ncbi:hypothetical protein HK099_008612 [Clydaea vesicula]|uniref:Glutathione hydrolase n=1 Tax=Clydaea vesicula TaxID=447962 RepID=A0AAD5XWT3_9FUNG|nr:hypothetical protein HK099_008612 [Clydaea vesicula]
MSARSKIVKPLGQEPDSLELQVAQNILDLEHNVADLKADLRGLQFISAKEIDVGHGKKAIVIFVPVPSLKQFHKVQSRLIRELEKKFSDRHVLLIAQRRIMGKPTRNSRVKQQRPRSRTLTSVHEKLLEDLVYPTEIVGKRTRVKVDGIATYSALPFGKQVYLGDDLKLGKWKGDIAVQSNICHKIAKNILEIGGNAVDAAISAGLCSGVINAYASGIGGGAFMLIQPSKLGNVNKNYTLLYDEFGVLFEKDDPVMIDCREKAPEKSTFDMFLSETEAIGGLAVGVPGELHCFEVAHKKWGVLSWYRLFEDSIKLAKDGFVVPLNLANRIEVFRSTIFKDELLKEVYAPDGKNLLKVGEICKRTRLALTLEKIAKEGISALYSGDIAESVLRTINNNGGIMKIKDIRDYRPTLRRPLIQNFRNKFKVITTQAPSSGPLILSMLNLLERFNVTEPDEEGYHLQIEAIKFGKAQKTILGDPSFDKSIFETVTRIIDKNTGKRNAAKINLNKTFNSKYYANDFENEDNTFFSQIQEHGTSHISVLTKSGPNNENFEAVALTTTINSPFGAQLVDSNSGIILNNQMDDFSKPYTNDSLGNPSNPRNFPKPFAKPQSSMTPTIIQNLESDHITVIGASGGMYCSKRFIL